MRVPSHPPPISSLPAGEKRPLWSVMIPVYNCSQFLSENLQSVLSQDLGEEQMQIEVVDDASTDADIERLVKLIGNGRITYSRQSKNVGSLRNFETCIKRSCGRLVHLLHGDDRVKPGFYNKMTHLLQQYPEAGAAFSSYSFINEVGEISRDYQLEEQKEGILDNWLIRIAERQRIQYAAMVVRREVYEQLGSFYGMTNGEDWEMWVRIARYFPVAYTPEILADYRGHVGSLTWENAIAGKTFQNLSLTIKYIQEHIPATERARVLALSKKHCAHFQIGMAISIWKKTRNLNYSQKLINDSWAIGKGVYLLTRILKFYGNVLLFKIQKK